VAKTIVICVNFFSWCRKPNIIKIGQRFTALCKK